MKRAFKKIDLREQHNTAAEKIEKEFGLRAPVARVLAARGFKADDGLRHFINPTLKDGLQNPQELKNYQEACDLVAEIAEAGASIAVCCDFDVDGLSGGTMLCNFLRAAGISSDVFVPDRFEDGYGLNPGMVKRIAEGGYGLLLTVDYGTTNAVELELAKELGLKTLVIDHHHVAINPPADVFINPQQEGCDFAEGSLCAAGLVWYLLSGLKKTVKGAEGLDPRSYLDFACLGTICDMVPLMGVNRVIAKKGLEYLSKTSNLGLSALKEVAGVREEVSAYHVGFGIGPRINAAGRMVSGELIVKLLTTEDSTKARKIAKKLNKINISRQETEVRITRDSVSQVQKQKDCDSGLVAWREDFHTGVIGIVAQRLVEKFYRPSIVMGIDNGSYKGSARGISGFSVVEALTELKEHFSKFGGHDGAGGFSLKHNDPEAFAVDFNAYCAEKLKSISSDPVAKADAEMSFKELDFDLIEEIKNFAPFGIGNPTPQFLIRNLEVSSVNVLKGEHIKATLSDGDYYLSGMMWRCNTHPALEAKKLVDIVCKPAINQYNGRRDIQLNLEAVQPAGSLS